MVVFDEELQSTDERVVHAFDLSSRKPVGGSVSSGTGTITKEGSAAVALNQSISISGDTGSATVIGGTDITSTGSWYLDVLFTLSNGEKVRGRVPLRVDV
jgi:hypothetical protein